MRSNFLFSTIYLIIILLQSNLDLVAQTNNTDEVILQKYWYYRWRLQNDFVKVGEGTGHSIPIQSRKGIWWVNDIEVVDATIYQGFYLGILATEYRLLLNNNRLDDAEKTKSELYYAIKAYERLDKFGEEMFGLEGFIDGYVARDDVPCDFIDSISNPENYAHFNQKLTTAPGTSNVFKIQTSDACFDGRPLENLHDPKITPEMSQDQVIWLLMGFMLVERSFDHIETSVKLLDGTIIRYNFNQQARRHATNMINYCRFKYPDKPNKTKWRVFRPDGQKVFPGQNVFMFKYPFSHIGKDMYTSEAENPQEFKRTPGRFQWGLTKIWIPYKNVNGQMITVLGALSAKWGKDKYTTAKRIQKTWRNSNWGNFYLPLMDYLHNIDLPNFQLEQKIKQDLMDAPIYGTLNMTLGIVEEFAIENGIPPNPQGWTRHIKYSSQELYQNDAYADTWTYRGFYAGLDYMLLHNLYYLSSNSQLPEYQNLCDRTIDVTEVGNLDNHKESLGYYGAFNSITVQNADSIQDVIRFKVGHRLHGTNVASKMRQRKIEVLYELFNPWVKSNIQQANYGWHEELNKQYHRWNRDMQDE
jgi:hypothetical protein